MAASRHLWIPAACLAAWLAAFCAPAQAEEDVLAGPAYARFRLTLSSGWREEVAGPFFYEQTSAGQRQWAVPPFFCRTLTPEVDWSEWELLYPLINYRRFGREYRLQLAQIWSLSGGDREDGNAARRATVFPLYFSQRSRDTNLNYTAVFPFYGHLENRMFRDDIKFLLFPLYSKTRKKDVVTDNYIFPIFDRRRGDGLTGWQVWPFVGKDRKRPTFRTNNLDNTVQTIGGYDQWFTLWPFYFNTRAGLGTTNPAASLTLVPFFSQTRSPSRDETSWGFPLGVNAIQDREQGYVEHDVLWPLFVRAHGSKTVTRYFPFYSRAEHNGTESLFYGFLLYKFNRLQAPPLERRRTRVMYFLYSDTVERNTQSREFKRFVDVWPFYSYHRDLDGNRRTQALAVLEPLFPNNRSIAREYSPLWALWRAEKNPHTGAFSQSLLWNLYRRQIVGQTKKASLLFGLFQYQSTPEGGGWHLCHRHPGRKAAGNAAKS
jgi:hypothetical protein